MIAIALLVGGVALAFAIVTWSMRGVDGATRIALAAMLGVAATAFNLVVPIPNVELTTTMVLCVALVLGVRLGIAVGLVAVVGGSLVGGVGAWTVWQLVGVSVVALGGGLLGNLQASTWRSAHQDGLASRLLLGCVVATLTLTYDVVVTVPTALMLAPVPGATPTDQAWAALLIGAPYTAVHVVACVVITLTCGPALLFTLARARTRLITPVRDQAVTGP